MTDIKKYELVSGEHSGLKMEQHKDGSWVFYEGYIIIVKKLERELYEYKQEVAELQEQLREAGLL